MHPSSSKKYDFLDSESSSDNSVSASFFLKKEPKQNDDDSNDDDVDIDSDDIEKFEDKLPASKLKASSSKNSFFADLIKSPETKPVDALSRFQQLENQIKSRQQNHAKLLQSLSDLEISSDESIKKELEKLKKPSSKFKEPKKEIRGVAVDSSSSAMTKQNTTTAEVSSSIPNVNEFLKPAKIPSPTRSRDQPKLTSVMKKRPSDSRKSVSFDLDNTKYSMDDDDDGEESLDSLIIASTSSDVTTSLDEIIESNLQNVMSLDDLVMGQDLQHDDQDSSSRGFQQNFQTIDNLVAISDRPSSRTSVSSVSSAVVAAGDRKMIDKRIENSNTKLQQLYADNDNNSVSTTTTIATATNNTSSYNGRKLRRKSRKRGSPSLERSRSPKTTSISEMSGISSSAAQEIADDDDDDDYSGGFETPSRSDTLKDTDSIASEIRETDDSSSYDGDSTVSATSSTATTMTQTSYDVTNDYTTMTSSADDATAQTNTTAASSVRRSKRKTYSRKHAVKNVKSCSVQTLPIRITKDYPEIPPELFSFYQPSHTNLLTHQSLALLTTHSPALLALQDVLKRQLQLTKDFVARSNALYEYQERALTANHHYTTLSDVTKIINKHRKKHNLPPMKTFS